jgi:EmrB/QacA subfamily drug resistance transporter
MALSSLQSTTGRWIMAAIILASAMAFIDSTALNVALPSIQNAFHAEATDLFWLLNSYLLILAALVMPGGSLGDKLGRKKMFMIGIVIFMLASAACGMAPDINYLIVFRAIQGIGGALMIPGSLSILTTSFKTSERGKAIGTWSAVTTIVTVGGPILGGALADAGWWRVIFFINIPIGVVSLFILWKKVPESKDNASAKQLDYAGAFSITTALALLTFGFLRIPEAGMYATEVLTSLLLGTAAFVLFIILEYKVKAPMMPLQLFANRTFSGTNLLTFFLYGGLFSGILFLTLNMVQIQGYSQLQAGLTLLPFTILLIVVSRWSGSLVDRFGPRWFLIGGPLVVAVGLLMLSFVNETKGPSSYFTSYFPGICVFGLGMSFTVTPLTTTVMGALANHYSGTASGINNALTRISNVFANAILGAVAIVVYDAYLSQSIDSISLSEKQKTEVLAQAKNLGDAHVPTNISKRDHATIATAYRKSFLHTYSLVMRISGALSLTAAAMAFLFINNDAIKSNNDDNNHNDFG